MLNNVTGIATERCSLMVTKTTFLATLFIPPKRYKTFSLRGDKTKWNVSIWFGLCNPFFDA